MMEGCDDPSVERDTIARRSRLQNSEQRNANKTKFRAMTFSRKRAVTACESCRARKSKCDNARPVCSTCLARGAPCSYDPRIDHSSFDPASLLIIEKLNCALQKLDELSKPEASDTVFQDTSIPGHGTTQHNNTQDLSQASGHDHASTYCSLDSLEVSKPFASTDYVLTWPIFANKWPHDYISRELYVAQFQSTHEERGLRNGGRGHNTSEEDAPELVERFLQNVHSKNPILQPRGIRADAKRIAENGFGWDASSCLVLLACSLGSISLPLQLANTGGQLYGRRSVDENFDRRTIAESYYQLARKRLGLLDGSIAACQCHLLSGIYLMYTFRQLQAWTEFHKAASTYSLYLKGKAAYQEHHRAVDSEVEASERRSEQRLYWTCLKSECEIRTELDLPQSDLCHLGYPFLFPSPPTPSSPIQRGQDGSYARTPLSNTTLSPFARSDTSYISSQEAEEQSWFYYLSEIAQRRIENRVLNAFYDKRHHAWSQNNLRSMLRDAEDIEVQIMTWYNSLPEVIRFDDTPPGDMNELSLMTKGRNMTIKLLLYRPFLYYTVHSRHALDEATAARLEPLVHKALELCIDYTLSIAPTHRHHGAWYGLRTNITCALMLCAARLAGLVTWDHHTVDADITQENRYGQAFVACLERLRYWEAESPDCTKAIEVLESLQSSMTT